MLLNPDQVIIGIAGVPLIQANGENGNSDVLWTMRDVVVSALYGSPETKATGIEKYERGKLADRIYSATAENPADLTVKEVDKIKDLVGDAYTVALVTPVWDILERLPQTPETTDEDEFDETEPEPPKTFKANPPS